MIFCASAKVYLRILYAGSEGTQVVNYILLWAGFLIRCVISGPNPLHKEAFSFKG